MALYEVTPHLCQGQARQTSASIHHDLEIEYQLSHARIPTSVIIGRSIRAEVAPTGVDGSLYSEWAYVFFARESL